MFYIVRRMWVLGGKQHTTQRKKGQWGKWVCVYFVLLFVLIPSKNVCYYYLHKARPFLTIENYLNLEIIMFDMLNVDVKFFLG